MSRVAGFVFAGTLGATACLAAAQTDPSVADGDGGRFEVVDALRFDPMPFKQPASWSLDWRDPAALIDLLATRYRALVRYTERARVRAATVDADGRSDDASVLEQVLVGSFDHRGLVVEGPWSQALSGVSTAIGWRESLALREAAHARHLAMLPHLALRFSDRPIDFLGDASGAPVVTTGSELVTENARQLVRVDLDTVVPSIDGVHTSWELFVNPDSMLVERVEKRAREASGSETHTRIDIEPTLVVAMDAAVDQADPQTDEGIVTSETVTSETATSETATTVVAPPRGSDPPVLLGPTDRDRGSSGDREAGPELPDRAKQAPHRGADPPR